MSNICFLPSKNCNPRGAGHKPNRKTTLLQASVPALPVVSCKALKNVWVLKPYGTLWRSYLILRSSRFKCAMARPKHVLSILHVYIYIYICVWSLQHTTVISNGKTSVLPHDSYSWCILSATQPGWQWLKNFQYQESWLGGLIILSGMSNRLSMIMYRYHPKIHMIIIDYYDMNAM